MIIIIQAFVVAVAMAIVFFALSGKKGHAARAWKKILLCLLAIAMIIAVLFPETTNDVANLMGVGRGADLLLYVLTLGFIAYALNSYIRQQVDRDVTYRLARKIALLEANERYKKKK